MATPATRIDRDLILASLRGEQSVAEICQQSGLSPAAYYRQRRRYLRGKLPPGRAEVRSRVSAPVEILRDRWGIPHIYADAERDLFVGFGYAMAQDRLWQLEHMRRRATGTLAAILGPEALAADVRARLIGFDRVAAREVGELDEMASRALEAFAEGVNLWMEQTQGNWPVEFDLLGYEPEPWAPRHTIAVLRMLWWQLTGRPENIVAAEAAQRLLGEDLAAVFLSPEMGEVTILPPGSYEGQATVPPQPLRRPLGVPEEALGSNNWVVDGHKSTSGRPLLASDPHRPLEMPSELYEVHLSGAGYDVIGAAYYASPAIRIGHNDRIAWGITNLVASPRDVYRERVHPENPDLYWRADRWQPFHRETEQFEVRGAAPVSREIRFTPHGPVVDDILPRLDGVEGHCLTLRWVGMEHLDDVRALLLLNRARNWTEFREAVSQIGLAVLNFVYADVEGNIGYQAAGRVPIRGQQTPGVRPAWEEGHEWEGYVPPEGMPSVYNPARHWMATANNRPVPLDYPYPLYGAWAAGTRAGRISQLLTARERLSPQDFQRVQFDVHSLRADAVCPRLVAILEGSDDPAVVAAAGRLAQWDHEARPDRVGATIFESFFVHWTDRLLRARFPESLVPVLRTAGAAMGVRLLTEVHPWFPRGDTEAQVVGAMRDTLAWLRERLGNNPERWTWGRLHRVTFPHPLGRGPKLNRLLSVGPVACHGTGGVVNNLSHDLARPFEVNSGPEYRFVIDLARLSEGWGVNSLGQSGQPGSPHFDDQLRLWLEGGYHPLWTDRPTIEANLEGRTLLQPGQPVSE